jgi:putative redox protein
MATHVSIRSVPGELYTHQVTAGNHTTMADEPVELGGSDLGPNPYEYLLASLGSCTAITLRMYAERKDIPLEGVDVTLSYGRIHARDCADCESTTAMVDEIHSVVKLTGPLTDEQRARLMEIAERCPVHRTLSSETRIRTRPA